MKQISDKEKIEIMQHYLNGGEIECKFDDKDWSVVKPSWAWNDCFYRKKIYNYPLYFEYTDVHDEESEKFIVEFTGLNEGTVVQKTYSDWEIGHFDNIWMPHTNKDLWKEVDKPKELNKICNLKNKFETGNYICLCNLWLGVNKWIIADFPTFEERNSFKTDIIGYKLIHKKHTDILDAYLKDDNVEIEYETNNGFGFTYLEEDFLETYNEINQYRIKKPESHIVYECYRTNKQTGETEILSKLLTDNMLKILENEQRAQHTYHKTGRQFEIKLRNK